ncbi:MAG TPA: SIR2 family protein [Bryobacteraceae bacterium]|nr:SIR2 family protein [Bryobacteraceae bacterium]
MRWVAGGPDLPEELLQLLEDGHLVIFCGAGVSSAAGLPGFRELVKRIYHDTHEDMEAEEKSEFDRSNYDRVLWLLEKRIGSAHVRREVRRILHLAPDADVSTHRALLDLATGPEGACRLVTTNFDRGFELAASGTSVQMDAAPKLPVPKRVAWNSVVHLHGRISKSDPEGQTLVLTSADFGAAYLTDGWASHFLTRLFREFSVLFVGYSIEDPVVRYLMDALAAERAAGARIGKAFVLAPLARKKEEVSAWKAKGVTPLPYDARRNHKALHETLREWARVHRAGLIAKENIVRKHAVSRPAKPYDEDPVVSQIVWALKDKTGSPARAFATMDPPPPVEWLPVLDQHKLLELPSGQSSGVPLVGRGQNTVPPSLHPATGWPGDWLVRHLDKVEVLDWALNKGAILHPEFRRIVRWQLNHRPAMPGGVRKVWEILASEAPLIADGTYDSWSGSELQQSLKAGQWNLLLKREVLEALSPRLVLKPRSSRDLPPAGAEDDNSIGKFVEAEVQPLCRKDVWELLRAIQASPSRDRILEDLAEDSTELLRRALGLAELVERAGQQWDKSYAQLPSIEPGHNDRLYPWTALIELCRDSWLVLKARDPARARRMVERWKAIPYPLFRRLCRFAMAQSDLMAPEESDKFVIRTPIYRGAGEPPVENRDAFLRLSDEEVIRRLTPDVRQDSEDEARWRHLVTEQPQRAAELLSALAKQNVWPPHAWRCALEVLAHDKQIQEFWPSLAASLRQAPDELFEGIIGLLSSCLGQVAADLPDEEAMFWAIWDRCGAVAWDKEVNRGADPVFSALNARAGRLAEVLLDRAAAKKPRSRADLAPAVWQRLTRLAEGRGPGYELARVLLAFRLAWLYELDPDWAKQHLLKYFAWEGNPEAPAVWAGFLWRGDISPELWPHIKASFLDAFRHRAEMRQKAPKAWEPLCRLFGIISIHRPGWISDKESREALRSMDPDGRRTVAHVIRQSLEGAGDRAETLWKERIGPWLERAWPKDQALREPDSSLHLAMAATYAGGLFKQAVDTIERFLVGTEGWSVLVRRLLEQDQILRSAPEATLRLLAAIVDRNYAWPDWDLRKILNQIREVDPRLEKRTEYRKLDEYLRAHGF